MSNVYLTKIELKNIRCFDNLSVSLEENESPIQWTMILGDNATGKTTLLRAVALGLCHEGDAVALMKDAPGNFVRKGKMEGRIRVTLKQEKNENPHTITTTIIKASEDEPEIIRQFIRPEGQFSRADIFVCGYGPQRSAPAHAGYEKYEPINAVRGLFNHQITLQNPELILLRQEPGLRKKLEKKLLRILMLDAADCEITYPKTGFEIHGPWGHLPFEALSDGYRSTTHWILDFIGWLIYAERFSGDEEVGGIVLLDELEQHLHPKWQRHIISRIREQFPKVQFITSTHSPILASAVGKLPLKTYRDKLIHLELKPDRTIGKNEPDTLIGLNTDQVLASRAFDYLTDADPEVERVLAEASKLAGKGDQRTEDEEKRYQAVKSALKMILKRQGRTAVETDIHNDLCQEMKQEIDELERKVFGEIR